MKKDSVSCIICNRQTTLLLCVNLFVFRINIVISGPLSQEHGASSSMEGSCEYIEYALGESRQGTVFQLGVGRGAKNSSP
jgi:hypothetical protein